MVADLFRVDEYRWMLSYNSSIGANQQLSENRNNGKLLDSLEVFWNNKSFLLRSIHCKMVLQNRTKGDRFLLLSDFWTMSQYRANSFLLLILLIKSKGKIAQCYLSFIILYLDPSTNS